MQKERQWRAKERQADRKRCRDELRSKRGKMKKEKAGLDSMTKSCQGKEAIGA